MLSDGLEKIDDFVKVKSLSRVRLFVTPMDCSLPGSSVHGIFQAIVLEWIAISRGSSQPRDRTRVFYIGRRIPYHLCHLGSLVHREG